jgi:rusticyanin
VSLKGSTLAIIVVVLAVLGVGIGLMVSSGNRSNSGGMMGSESDNSSMSSYYHSMMGSYGGGSMMGGPNGSTTADPSYAWMMGGTNAPGWMDGGTLPGAMMGTSSDAGAVMGRLFANAPGERMSPSVATQLGNSRPVDATVNATDDRVTFSGKTVTLTALAGPGEAFRIAGLVNPTITVKAGSHVSIELVNTDTDAANGFVVTVDGAASSSMPMMNAAPSFSDSAVWFLGNRTSAGMHTGTLSFTAGSAGTYQYLCPVPGHAQKGMAGRFIVTT